MVPQTLQDKATATGVGQTASTGGKTKHMIEVIVTGTGAVSVTVEPRWSIVKNAGGGNLISSAQTVSGTDRASQTFTAEGAAEYISCPITALIGTSCTVTYKGA